MFDTKIGKIFFIGIGGIGMSGIAEVLVNQGFEVAGSDISENLNIARLRKLGVKINIGHSARKYKWCINCCNFFSYRKK